MALLSRVRFKIKVGSVATDTAGPWLDFDDSVGCITDWSGILSEGPIKGDIIEMDWLDGAEYQQGPAKPYSFDVPFAARVTNEVNPSIWDSYQAVLTIKPYRGPLLVMRREFYGALGTLQRAEQARGVLINDLTATVSIGRLITMPAVFQNLSGVWTVV